MIEKFDSIKGFLDLNEGIALYEEVKRVSENNFCVEIGSYCGKSTCFIGQACKENKSKLITIDHHKGSEEQQLGELYFDAEVYDEKLGRVNTLPLLEKNLAKFDLEEVVKPLVMDSISASKIVENNADLIFIDGSHTFESAESDSFSYPLLDGPHYTRPEIYNGMETPKILLSGHHKKIEKWFIEQRLEKTRLRRPDLWKKYISSKGKRSK